MMPEQIERKVYETKWGYMAYSYEDYLKLKKLNAAYFKARSQASQWMRWVRKAPHNRVRWRTIRNDAGQRIGSEVVGPRPEPPTCDMFSRKLVTNDRKPVDEWFMGWIKTQDHGIVEEYRKARRPMPTRAEVAVPGLTGERIGQLLAEAGC